DIALAAMTGIGGGEDVGRTREIGSDDGIDDNFIDEQAFGGVAGNEDGIGGGRRLEEPESLISFPCAGGDGLVADGLGREERSAGEGDGGRQVKARSIEIGDLHLEHFPWWRGRASEIGDSKSGMAGL